MNKYEGMTVLHIENSDYIDGALSPEVEREIDTADIVIHGEKVIKNRVDQIAPQQDGAKPLVSISPEMFDNAITATFTGAQGLQSISEEFFADRRFLHHFESSESSAEEQKSD